MGFKENIQRDVMMKKQYEKNLIKERFVNNWQYKFIQQMLKEKMDTSSFKLESLPF